MTIVESDLLHCNVHDHNKLQVDIFVQDCNGNIDPDGRTNWRVKWRHYSWASMVDENLKLTPKNKKIIKRSDERRGDT